MYVQPVAEHVPHHQQVGVVALHRHSVHGEELREQRAAVTGDDVLPEKGRERHMFTHFLFHRGSRLMTNRETGLS